MKINYYGKRVSSFKETVKKLFRILLVILIISTTIIATFFIGAYTFSSTTVQADNIHVVSKLNSPVLARIADCESGNGKRGTGTQFRNGQVLIHANKNRTADIGKYQININIWGKKATKLGFNLATEKGNTKMAQWIYLNRGTSPWFASRICWSR